MGQHEIDGFLLAEDGVVVDRLVVAHVDGVALPVEADAKALSYKLHGGLDAFQLPDSAGGNIFFF